MSLVFLRSHPDLVQAIEEAQRTLSASTPSDFPLEQAKDQIIAALRRRLDDLKQQLAIKDAQLRERQTGSFPHFQGLMRVCFTMTILRDTHRDVMCRQEG